MSVWFLLTKASGEHLKEHVIAVVCEAGHLQPGGTCRSPWEKHQGERADARDGLRGLTFCGVPALLPQVRPAQLHAA